MFSILNETHDNVVQAIRQQINQFSARDPLHPDVPAKVVQKKNSGEEKATVKSKVFNQAKNIQSKQDKDKDKAKDKVIIIDQVSTKTK